MMEVYTLVQCKEKLVHRIIKYIMLVLAIVTLCLNFLVPTFLWMPLTFFIIWFFMNKAMKEYEYAYFDGEFKFYVIKNKSRRKGLKKCDIDHVSAIAPRGDRSMYRYEQELDVKKLDFTSGEDGALVYEMIVNNEEGTTMISFEPDEKFLDAICFKNSAKVKKAEKSNS